AFFVDRAIASYRERAGERTVRASASFPTPFVVGDADAVLDVRETWPTPARARYEFLEAGQSEPCAVVEVESDASVAPPDETPMPAADFKIIAKDAFYGRLRANGNQY